MKPVQSLSAVLWSPSGSALASSAGDGGWPLDSVGPGSNLKPEVSYQTLIRMMAGLQAACAQGCSCGNCLPADPVQALAAFKARDAEVERHELAHLQADGVDATSGPVYEKMMGPDGQYYRVGGHVCVSLREDDADPQQTLDRMVRIMRASLAPDQPSGQDMLVASQAAAKADKARVKLSHVRATQGPAPNRPAH